MMRTFIIAGTLFGTLLFWQTSVLADGKEHGLHRGLREATKGMSGGAMPRSGDSVSRAGKGPLRNGASMGRASGGLQRANDATSPSIEMPSDTSGHDRAIANQQSILNHRLDQADHLRELSDRNGNEHLQATADRMEANANRNYQRQQTRLTGATTTDPSSGSSGTGGTTSDQSATGTLNTAATATPTVVPQARRGLWFRSR